MRTIILLLLGCGWAAPLIAGEPLTPASARHTVAPLHEVVRLSLPAAEVAAAVAVERSRPEERGLYRFAVAQPVPWSLRTSGSWETLADGARLWRLRIASSEAHNLNLALNRFDLPDGGRLWLYDTAGERVAGPYTPRHRTPAGELWTPLLPVDEVVLEAYLPSTAFDAEGQLVPDVGLEIGAVNHGFRGPSPAVPPKQGACNIDVACPQGDAWRDQIRSVAWFTLNGIGICTGTLVNNTAGDFKPYLLTAAHCEVSFDNAGSMVIYWNYESPTCGQLGGGSLDQNQSGAVLRASSDASDFALVELLEPPPAEFGVYYAGWDATGDAVASSVGIHHPRLDEKAISRDADPLLVDNNEFWRVEAWNEGTTERGSSGSCLFDEASGLCVGTLTGGFASCSVPDGFDVYGRMSAHWNGPNATSRLRDWLDPGKTGLMRLAGGDPATPPGIGCAGEPGVACLNNGRFRVTVAWRDFEDDQGIGQVVQGAANDSALFWFFREDNWEMLIKVLDGCRVNGRFWVLAAAATNIEYTLTVTDTVTGLSKQYTNPLGTNSPAITDVAFFQVCQ